VRVIHPISACLSELGRQNDAGSQEPSAVPLISILALWETIALGISA
jgi:hypothetical protein